MLTLGDFLTDIHSSETVRLFSAQFIQADWKKNDVRQLFISFVWNLFRKKSKNHNVDCMEHTGNGHVNDFILHLRNYQK